MINTNLTIPNSIDPTKIKTSTCRIREIVTIVALAVLAAMAVFIAATAGLVLSGVVACVIAALSTAVLITAATVVYKTFQARNPTMPQKAKPEWTLQMLESRVDHYFQNNLTVPTEPLEVLSDVDAYVPPIHFGQCFDSFDTTEFAIALREMDAIVNKTIHSSSPIPQEIIAFAKEIKYLLQSHSDLMGWSEVVEFLRDPNLYLSRNSAYKNYKFPPGTDLSPRQQEGFSKFDQLKKQGDTVVKKYIQRIEWVYKIFKRENIPFNPGFCLNVLLTENNAAIKEFFSFAETTIVEILTKNPQRFHVYREFRKAHSLWPHTQPLWPHSQQVLNEIEKTGFKWIPFLARLDHCKCLKCGVEVAGWRPWMDPEQLHDKTRH